MDWKYHEKYPQNGRETLTAPGTPIAPGETTRRGPPAHRVEVPTPLPSLVPPIQQIPAAGATSAQMDQLLTAVNTLTLTMAAPSRAEYEAERDRQKAERGGTDSFEEAIKPAGRAWKALKWSLGLLVGGAATIFALGTGYQKAIGDNATKADIEAHSVKDLAPVVAEVKALKVEMEPVKAGVKTLVNARESERAYKKAKRKLDKYDKEYQDAMQDYTADRVAGKRTARPTMNEAYVDLEEEVTELEKKL